MPSVNLLAPDLMEANFKVDGVINAVNVQHAHLMARRLVPAQVPLRFLIDCRGIIFDSSVFGDPEPDKLYHANNALSRAAYIIDPGKEEALQHFRDALGLKTGDVQVYYSRDEALEWLERGE